MIRIALAALLCLASCSSESRPAAGDSADEWLPLVRDAVYVYEIHSSLGDLKLEVRARGELPQPTEDGSVFVMDERTLGPSLGFVEVAPVGYVVGPDYIARLAGIDYAGKGKLRLLGEDQPTWILPREPKPGHRWIQETRLFGTPEHDGARLGWTGEVVGERAVDVPAGHFENALEVRSSYSDEGPDPQVLYTDWYVRGIGLVRSLTEDPSGNRANQIEQVLIEYHFPR